MADYTSGYTAALNSAQARELQALQAAFERERLTQARTMFQQQQEQQQRMRAARAGVGNNILPFLAGGGAPGAQPPMPGQPSVPMMPPPPGGGGMPPGGGGPPTAGGPPMPSPAMAGQFLTMPPPPAPGSPPPGAPMAQTGGPGAPMPGQPPRPAGPGGAPPGPPGGMAPPPPPDSWKGLPAPPGGGPAPGGIPAPPEDVVMPRQVVSVGDMAKLLKSRGIEGEAAMDMLDQWKPYMDSANKAELDKMKVHVTAQTAAVKAYQAALAQAAHERHDRVTEEQGAKRLVQGDKRIAQGDKRITAASGGGSEGLSERYKSDPQYKKQVDFWAKLLNSGQSLPPRFAQSGAGKKMYGDIIAAVPTLGSGNPSDISAGKLNLREMTAEAQKLGTQSASVAIANKEMMRFIPLAEKAIDAVPRTGWRPINQLVQAGENTWSPEQKALVIANRSVQNAYAQLIQRGAPTVHSLGEAEKLLNTADSPEVYKAAMKQLRLEGEQAEEGLKDAHEDLMKRARTTVGSERPDKDAAAREFKTEAEAQAAGLAPGTRVKINGVSGTWH